MINAQKLDETMLELGHSDNLIGTDYLRQGIALYEAGARAITKELYPAIAKAANSTPARVERTMRHSIERAWERGSWDAQMRCFGHSIDPRKGCPTVSEYLARMARICHED